MKALKSSLALLALSVFATPAWGESDTHCVSVHVIDWYIELRNECDRDVHYHYCIVNANTSGTSLIGAGPMAALHDCANDGGGFGRISAGGRSTAVQSDALGENSEFRWFACAMPRLPEDWDWKTNRGYCRTAKESAAARRKGGGSGNVPRATREDRRALQTALKTEGFNPGPADGSFGPRTRAAVQAWQRSIGQEPTGELTANQMRRLQPGRWAAAQPATPSAGGGWEAPESVTRAAAEARAAAAEARAAAALSPKCADLAGNHERMCWHELDDQPGCHVYMWNWENPVSSIRGTGECRGAQLARGSVVTHHRDGGVMEGPVVDGKMNGRWVIRLADGNVKEGPYVDSKGTGVWVYRFTNGNVAEGPIVNDKKNGRWVERWANGRVDEGSYVDDKRDGRWDMRNAVTTTGGRDDFFSCWRAGESVDC